MLTGSLSFLMVWASSAIGPLLSGAARRRPDGMYLLTGYHQPGTGHHNIKMEFARRGSQGGVRRQVYLSPSRISLNSERLAILGQSTASGPYPLRSISTACIPTPRAPMTSERS